MYEFRVRLRGEKESINGQSNLRILAPSHEVPSIIVAARPGGAKIKALRTQGKRLLYAVTQG